jgi:hypothetical protein
MFPLRSIPASLTVVFLASPAAVAETVQLTLMNGDTIHAELITEESSDELKVLMHPQLGRLEVSKDAIKPVEKPPAWKTTFSAGVNAGDQDGDGTFSANINGSSNYKGDTDKLKIQGGLNYSKNNDKGKPSKVKTEKGMASIRYDRVLGESMSLYAMSKYQYNGLNDSAVNNVDGSVGVAFPVVNTDTTELTLSVGPSVHWSDGGKDCASNEYCGNTYAGGSFIADLSWSPNKSFKFDLSNTLSALAANEIKPSNTFSASIKYFPSINSGLFTSLRYVSIYNSISTPESDQQITGQVGVEF